MLIPSYHVMNSGCARQKFFHDERYCECFLAILAEVHQKIKGGD